MPDLAAATQRLRKVRQAREMFLSLWAMESLDGAPSAVDRILTDVLAAATAVLDPDEHDAPPGALWRRRF
jgi:hypothetical protein